MSEWIKRLTERYSEVNEKKKMDPVNPDELKGTHAQRKDKDIDNDGDVDKSDEYLHNRRKAVNTAMKKEEVELDEAKLAPQQRDRLDDLILNVHMTTHPEYDGEEEPTKYLNMIRKEFGDKVAKQVKDGIEIAHWGRDNRSSGNDKLSWRKGGARITKSGKMNKQDAEALKNRIKRDKQWGGITKKVKLPEEVELDEAAPKLKGDWLKKEREKNREHDAAMGRTATGRKKPQRAMTSTQRSLASMRKENEVQVEEATIQPATRKGYQDPMGVGLSPSAKVELGRTTDAPSDAFDANKVIAKTFKDMRASLKNKKMRKGDQDIGDKAPVKNDGK